MSAIPASEWSNPSLNLDFDDLPVERTLGVNWNCQLNTLQITTRKLNQVNTKREMLSAIHITQASPVDVQKMSILDIGPILWMSVGEPRNIPTAETEIQGMSFF